MARILIVEDNPACAELARVVCVALGHRAHVAQGREQALAMAADHRFDLAVVAHAFGPGLVAALRGLAPGLAVVATTPQPLANARAAYAALRSIEILPKPFVVRTLRDRLDAALAA